MNALGKDMRIAIIGGGIGGLTLALALNKYGYSAKLYEQSSALREVGAGITLWPNANKVLFALGLEEKLTAAAVEPESQKLFHFQTRKVLQVFPRGPTTRAAYGAPLYQLHRRDLHDTLIAAVEERAPETIHLANQAVGVEPMGNAARVRFANGAEVEADLVVACDGIRSQIRESVFGHEEPLFTNIIAWRALVPAERVAKEMRDDPTGVVTGPDSNFAHYRVRRGTLFNYLAFAVVDHWEEEGWRIPARVEDVLDRFADYHPDIKGMIASTPPENLFKWGLFDREVRDQWSSGPVTLLGDAAHPMLPFLGQGAGMVIEDALILARALSLSGSLDEALNRYEKARHGRARYALEKSRAHGQYYNTHPDKARDEDLSHQLDLCEYDALNVAI
jgi:salicylate hydroxylase